MTKANKSNQNKRGLLLHTGKFLLITGISLMLTVCASAQEFDGDPDDPVPFDGGISLLAAAGVAYGVKQWHNKRKENNDPEQDAKIKE